MTDRERAYLERTGGCKACGAIHPLRLCSHPKAREISQQLHEARTAQAAKRSREGNTGETPEAKRQDTSKGPAASSAATNTGQQRTEAVPQSREVTRKEKIRESYNRVTANFNLFIHKEGRPVKEQDFFELKRKLYYFHADTMQRSFTDKTVHTPVWTAGLQRRKIGKEEHVVIGLKSIKCREVVERWLKLTFPQLDYCHREDDLPGTRARFTGFIPGMMAQKLDDKYFNVALKGACQIASIRGLVTLGGVRPLKKGGVVVTINLDEQAKEDLLRADCRLCMGPEGMVGFVEAGKLDTGDKIRQEKTVLQTSIERLEREQKALQERWYHLDTEETERQFRSVQVEEPQENTSPDTVGATASTRSGASETVTSGSQSQTAMAVVTDQPAGGGFAHLLSSVAASIAGTAAGKDGASAVDDDHMDDVAEGEEAKEKSD